MAKHSPSPIPTLPPATVLYTIATRSKDPKHRLRELFRYGIGHVIWLQPWDLNILAFFPTAHITVIVRTNLGALYYVSGTCRYWIAMTDGSVYFGGHAEEAMAYLLEDTRDQLIDQEIARIFNRELPDAQ